jgi:hypothetical protein
MLHPGRDRHERFRLGGWFDEIGGKDHEKWPKSATSTGVRALLDSIDE